jgi:bile acid:Na+ symporter, BASS family
MAISMLMDLLSKAATVAMLSFVVSSMLAMGAGLTVARIIEPLRNVRLVLFALVANFVLMPAGAVALAKALRLDEPFGVGMLLLGCAAGAPFLPKLAELAKGNLAFAVGVMVLLMVVTVGYLPIVLPLLLPGVTVDPWQIARSLVLLMLLPLAAGLVLKSHYEDFATEAKRVLDIAAPQSGTSFDNRFRKSVRDGRSKPSPLGFLQMPPVILSRRAQVIIA